MWISLECVDGFKSGALIGVDDGVRFLFPDAREYQEARILSEKVY